MYVLFLILVLEDEIEKTTEQTTGLSSDVSRQIKSHFQMDTEDVQLGLIEANILIK